MFGNTQLFETFLWVQAKVLELSTTQLLVSIFIAGIVGGIKQNVFSRIITMVIVIPTSYIVLSNIIRLFNGNDVWALATVVLVAVASSLVYKAHNTGNAKKG